MIGSTNPVHYPQVIVVHLLMMFHIYELDGRISHPQLILLILILFRTIHCLANIV